MSLQPKKMLILNILEILRKHTNADHPITQRKIAEYLERDYGMVAERKAIKRNLAELMEAGYPVRMKTEKARNGINRKTGETEENIACSDFYYEHPFSDAELRMLIDSVLFSRSTPKKQGRELIRKLEAEFTQRELEMLRFICQGMTNAEIADRLNLRPGTVKNMVSLLLSKTGYISRAQLARYAVDKRLVD